jgi:hypothetical protein
MFFFCASRFNKKTSEKYFFNKRRYKTNRHHIYDIYSGNILYVEGVQAPAFADYRSRKIGKYQRNRIITYVK